MYSMDMEAVNKNYSLCLSVADLCSAHMTDHSQRIESCINHPGCACQAADEALSYRPHSCAIGETLWCAGGCVCYPDSMRQDRVGGLPRGELRRGRRCNRRM